MMPLIATAASLHRNTSGNACSSGVDGFDADLAAVVGAEPEPHILVGLRQRRVGRAGADGVDADALLEQRIGLACDVRADACLLQK